MVHVVFRYLLSCNWARLTSAAAFVSASKVQRGFRPCVSHLHVLRKGLLTCCDPVWLRSSRSADVSVHIKNTRAFERLALAAPMNANLTGSIPDTDIAIACKRLPCKGSPMSASMPVEAHLHRLWPRALLATGCCSARGLRWQGCCLLTARSGRWGRGGPLGA